MSKLDKLKTEREKRILDYIAKGMTTAEIGEREGWDSYYAGRQRTAVAIKYLKQAKFLDTERTGPTYGLSKDTHFLRFGLGDRLNDLDQKKKLHYLEIARDVGISHTNQKVASGFADTERNYDWRLSQIERLAKVVGVNPTQLIINSLKLELEKQAKALTDELKKQGKSEKIGVGQMVEKWIEDWL